MTETVNTLLENFSSDDNSAPAWLQTLRQQARTSFQTQGLPTRKHELWKYTDLKGLSTLLGQAKSGSSSSNAPSSSSEAPAEDPVSMLNEFEYLLFINGVMDLNNSKISNSIAIKPLSDSENYLNSTFDLDKHSFASLNTATCTHGQLVEITKTLTKPLAFVYLTTGSSAGASDDEKVAFDDKERTQDSGKGLQNDDRGTHPNSEQADTNGLNNCFQQIRNIILVNNSAKASLLELHIAENQNSDYCCNQVNEIILKDHAELEHVKIVKASNNSYLLGHQFVEQAANSHYQAHAYSFSGKLIRDQIQIKLVGEKAKSNLYGFYHAKQGQHIDQYSLVEHLASQTKSNEFYKGIASDNGHGVFNGKVHIVPEVTKIEAHQNNKNLLLSDKAEIDTKPELEIYADDVICSHGAAVGQLDDEALFYLQSRGLSKTIAKQLLLQAFSKELLNFINNPQLKSLVTHFYEQEETADD